MQKNPVSTVLIVTFLWAVCGNNAFAVGDADNGEQLAAQWCVSCHYVGEEPRAVAVDQAPAFATVAQYTDDRLGTFLTRPHPPMPNLDLAREHIDDIIAYLRTLVP